MMVLSVALFMPNILLYKKKPLCNIYPHSGIHSCKSCAILNGNRGIVYEVAKMRLFNDRIALKNIPAQNLPMNYESVKIAFEIWSWRAWGNLGLIICLCGWLLCFVTSKRVYMITNNKQSASPPDLFPGPFHPYKKKEGKKERRKH